MKETEKIFNNTASRSRITKAQDEAVHGFAGALIASTACSWGSWALGCATWMRH